MRITVIAILMLVGSCALKQEYQGGTPNPQTFIEKTSSNFAGKNSNGNALTITTLTEDVRFMKMTNKLDQDVIVVIGSTDWEVIYKLGDVEIIDFGADGAVLPSGTVIKAYHRGGGTDPTTGSFVVSGMF